jgi:hypothetical protein
LTAIRSIFIVTKITITKERFKRRSSVESPERKNEKCDNNGSVETVIKAAAPAQQRYAQFDQTCVDEILRAPGQNVRRRVR